MEGIVKLQETCETCRLPHSFTRSKTGTCEYLEAATGEEMIINRFTRCKNYQRDTAKWKDMLVK